MHHPLKLKKIKEKKYAFTQFLNNIFKNSKFYRNII
jgi:hypothetical protein